MSESELKRFIIEQAALGSRIYGTNVCGRLYGPAAADSRQRIMAALSGKSVPKSKCGANAVRAALVARFGAVGDCIAAVDADLQRLLETA